jgi:hypothetical protein
MTTNFLRALAMAGAGLLIAPLATLSAQGTPDIQYASHTELSDIYTRLENLESHISTSNVTYNGGPAASSCTACCNDCCSRAGVIGGAELLWLKPYHAEADFGDFDYQIGYRFWAGWQLAGGLGAQIRIFDYFQRGQTDPLQRFDVTAVDLEIYDAIQPASNWDLIIGGGIRYLDYLNVNNDLEFGAITGVGPVITAQLVRHLGDRSAIYGIVRDSIIFGDDTGFQDICTNIFELQLGAQYQRDWNGALVFARLGWEAQYYTDNTEDDSEGVALAGGVIGLGLMR